MFDLKDKSILITGAAAGIGRAAALLAARAGAMVTVSDRVTETGAQTARDIVAAGGVAQFVEADIAQEADAARIVERAIAAYGRLDGALNNAAIAGNGLLLHEMTEAQFRRVQDINLTGTFLCMKHELIAMMAQGGGAIVNIAAAAGATAVPRLGEYMASKAGVIALTKSAALDYAVHGIRVNAVLPGTIRTAMAQGAIDADPGLEAYLIAQQPVGRLGEPEEIAAAVIWLLSDAASFTTGACMPVDGGFLL